MMAACIALVVIVFIFIWNGWIGYMPDMEDLQNPIDKYATQIYSADGKVIGTWNQDRENRILVSFDKVSPYVVQALVATEDVRYYEHSGIDFIALARAIVKRGLLGQSSAGGGSTITQQLAKQLYSDKAHSTFERMLQKPIEWVIATKLERNFTKEEIVMMYLNQFDFLHNAVGIKTASNTYFSKEPQDLQLEEAALLIGLCKNPSYFNPVRHEERCKERRNVVLQQMEKAGYISHEEYTAAPPVSAAAGQRCLSNYALEGNSQNHEPQRFLSGRNYSTRFLSSNTRRLPFPETAVSPGTALHKTGQRFEDSFHRNCSTHRMPHGNV